MRENQIHTTETTLWNRPFIMLLIMSTFINSASQMVTPLVSKYAVSLGAPLTLAATISSLMSFAALFLRPVAGLFSDHYNRKLIVLISNILIVICMLLMAVTKSVPMMVAVRLLHGVAFSFNGVALMAFNTVFIPKDRLGEGMGWMALGNTLAQALGPNMGIILVEMGGYMLCFSVAAGICMAGIAVVFMMPYRMERTGQSAKKLDIRSLVAVEILPFAAVLCLFACGSGLVSSLLVLYGDDRGIAGIGLFFTAYSVMMILVRPLAGRLIDKKGLSAVLYPAIAAFALCFLLLGSTTSIVVVILAGVLKAVGQGSGVPALQSTGLKIMGREKAGVVSSTCFIGQDIGNTIAPMIGGFVAQYFGYGVLFNGFSVVFLIGACLIYRVTSRKALWKGL